MDTKSGLHTCLLSWEELPLPVDCTVDSLVWPVTVISIAPPGEREEERDGGKEREGEGGREG